MWIVMRCNEETREYLKLSPKEFRSAGDGMHFPFEDEMEAIREIERFRKTEPDWDYSVQWFGR